MHDQPDELLAARDQMEQLVQVIVDIGSDLDLDGTLHGIVKAAMALTGARIGALGIRGADGSPATFVHTGRTATPRDCWAACRSARVSRRRSARVSPGRRAATQMQSDPGVARDPDQRQSSGLRCLYLADDRPGRVFSDRGRRRASAGSAAAVAIDNARLFERERETAKWTRASREITAALLSGDPRPGRCS